MEVSTVKSKIMMNSTINTSADVTMNGKAKAEVTSFKYLGASLSKDGISTAETRMSYCHGDRSDDQTEQVVDMQSHQLPHHVHAL
ncbi:hypothetical protein DPMN_064395 [Dreissena polymorpha]|uniref:Uncharacterized protein n=1 Tax=Dreissena polymorpha TaxID=45954 RepID=A0A9D4CDI5_DREPO|nr:hypothetical protein DPMN_064395 [Dreissena polymorpha]